MHDLDYDKTVGDMSKHGLVAAKLLERKIPEECLHAIQAHDYRTGVKPEGVMDKALIASDCIWGLIVRTALATSNRKIRQIEVNMLKDKLRDESFPKFLANGIIMCGEISLTLEGFFKLALKSLPKEWTIDESDM